MTRHFRLVQARLWKRLGALIPHWEDRPHLVPATELGQLFTEAEARAVRPCTRFPLSEVEVDGKWTKGFRFLQLDEATAEQIIEQLSWQAETLLQAGTAASQGTVAAGRDMAGFSA
jgi:hypothetical protein